MANKAISKPIAKEYFLLGSLAGNLATSVATRLVKLGILAASRIFTAHRNPESRAAFTSLGIHLSGDSSS
ncbi:hypothetical protein PanWU01x14_210220 [Parasponia andersonii]|uniref:Uncharacterized protein n=1 Tax=Parasponia andersonii TaxID=3476 RepID=A0A2P5BU49_PARAD|nr:hypothetical protein PanWU01x14_210220 [Parasponia andersonii]